MSNADLLGIKREIRISAIAVSRGVGIGYIVEFRNEETHVVHHTIQPGECDLEIGRVHQATEQCRIELEALVAENLAKGLIEVAGIFRVQLAILLDASFIEAVEARIKQQFCNAEWSVFSAAAEFALQQAGSPNASFREKQIDIADICSRLIAALRGAKEPDWRIFSGSVILADELRPSTILQLRRHRPAGLITKSGGWTSHSSIVAREFRIPMITSVRAAESGLGAGDHAIVDGDSGTAIVNPSYATLDAFASLSLGSESAISFASSPKPGICMQDGTTIVLRANADTPESYRAANGLGACGVGLYRSETLILTRSRIPNEDEQAAAYTEITKSAGAYGVKIRTFDIGIDRYLDGDRQSEQNPALGLRSIRLSLREEEFFRQQIRAILRAAVSGKPDILLPMVGGSSEVIRAAAVIAEERARLSDAGVSIGNTNLGAMIEVPSGVLMAPEIAKRVDFLALGTNDLVQYLLAVDRDNYSVADWYQTLHPAVLRAVRSVAAGAAAAHIPLIVCGEMAASPFYLPILLGLGVRELSISANSIRQIRRLAEGISIVECVDLVDEIEQYETADEIEVALRSFYADRWSHLMPDNLLIK